MRRCLEEKGERDAWRLAESLPTRANASTGGETVGCRKRTLVGRTYRSKRWARRWAAGRPVRRVKGGWRIGKGRKRKGRR